jgi:flagellar protein FliS
MHKAAQAFFQTQVNTTSQGDLLLMLYDGAIKFLKQAKEKIEERDYAQKGILISKAIDVISELDGSLNESRGGELAENLHKLYFYCNTRLLQANLNMDVQKIDDVIKILMGLRSAFSQVVQGNISAQAMQDLQASAKNPDKAKQARQQTDDTPDAQDKDKGPGLKLAPKTPAQPKPASDEPKKPSQPADRQQPAQEVAPPTQAGQDDTKDDAADTIKDDEQDDPADDTPQGAQPPEQDAQQDVQQEPQQDAATEQAPQEPHADPQKPANGNKGVTGRGKQNSGVELYRRIANQT